MRVRSTQVKVDLILLFVYTATVELALILVNTAIEEFTLKLMYTATKQKQQQQQKGGGVPLYSQGGAHAYIGEYSHGGAHANIGVYSKKGFQPLWYTVTCSSRCEDWCIQQWIPCHGGAHANTRVYSHIWAQSKTLVYTANKGSILFGIRSRSSSRYKDWCIQQWIPCHSGAHANICICSHNGAHAKTLVYTAKKKGFLPLWYTVMVELTL